MRIISFIFRHFDFRASFLLGLGIFVIFGFIYWIASLIVNPLDQIGRTLTETISLIFFREIKLSPYSGLPMIMLLAFLFGRILRTQQIEQKMDSIVSKIPLLASVWKIVRATQRGLEELNHYTPVLIETFHGSQEIFLVKRVLENKIKLPDGEWQSFGWQAEGFLPSINNPTSGRALRVSLDKVKAIIDHQIISEILPYILSCTISAPKQGWQLREVDWQKDFGIPNKTEHKAS